MREQIPSFALTIFLPVLIFVPSTRHIQSIFVWDIKTGVIVKDIVINVEGFDRIVFSGHYTVTLVTDCCDVFRTYDALDGTLICKEEILPRKFDRRLDAHWKHGEFLRLATSYATDEKLAIDIHQLRPPSIPPFPTIESFIVPPHDGQFSFSPVSFHASFVTGTEFTVLDVRDSKILMRAEAPRKLYLPPGRFSPDGGFFACGTLEGEIRIWKNTSVGYTTWCSLKPRLRFDSFSFSPTTISILAWDQDGVQLLDNHTQIPLSDQTTTDHDDREHLVAYSKDGTRVVTARRGGNVITVLDPLSDAPQQSINTAIRILDVGIVGNTVFTTDLRKAVRWDLGVGKVLRRVPRITAVEIEVTRIEPTGECSTPSTGCSWITFTIRGSIFLYGFRGQLVLYRRTVDRDVMDIRFAPDGHQLCFIPHISLLEAINAQSCMAEQLVDLPNEFTEDVNSRDGPFSRHGYRISRRSEWIEGDGDRKLLWLPPNWRLKYSWKAAWNGKFLVLVDGRLPLPIIIAF